MLHRASRPLLVTAIQIAFLVLCPLTSALQAQLNLPPEFDRRLGQRGMALDPGPLSGYALVPVVSNPDMEYDVAMRS